tara:strand:- start:2040 stop:2525 length:486 start_codon:yes stop_codon:yes gene_type:complete
MKPLPLLTFSFIDWLEDQDTKEKTLVEFGCGESTIYFSKRFKKIITYEDDDYWIHFINSHNLNNVETKVFKQGFYKNDLELIKNADFILIDNHPHETNNRLYTAEVLMEKINYQNTLILDNGNLNAYAYFYLKSKYEKCKDFIGNDRQGPGAVTSVFNDRK